jgi:hypothetical protein
MKNLNKLTRKDLGLINGGDIAYAFCIDGVCPPLGAGYITYCDGDKCFKTPKPGGGNPGGGCHEPRHFCQEWETGCGCVYF